MKHIEDPLTSSKQFPSSYCGRGGCRGGFPPGENKYYRVSKDDPEACPECQREERRRSANYHNPSGRHNPGGV